VEMSYQKSGVYLLDTLDIDMLPVNELSQSAVYLMTIVPSKAKELVQKKGFISGISSEATAEVLSKLLGVDVPVSKSQVKMDIGDEAILIHVFEGQYILYYVFVFLPSFPPSSPPSLV